MSSLNNQKKLYFTSIICCFLFALILYLPTLTYPFIYDDIPNILENKVFSGRFDLGNIYYLTKGQANRLIVFYSFYLNYLLSGFNSWSYHLVNMIIHAANGIFVYIFVQLLFLTPAMDSSSLKKHTQIISLFTALMFVAHPLQTQAVTYISQRAASLATMFYLLTCLSYLKARLSVLTKTKILYFFLSINFAILSMLTKEISFTLFLMVGLLEIMFFYTAGNDKQRSIAKLVGYLTPFLFLFVFAIYHFKSRFLGMFSADIISQSHENDVITFVQYGLTQFRVLSKFLQLFIYPVGQQVIYDFPKSSTLLNFPTMISFLLIFALFLTAVFSWKKYRIASFGIFWFLITLSINFIPRPYVIFEHKLYLSSIGLCLSLTALIVLCVKNNSLRKLIFTAIIIVLSLFTFNRNMVWKDAITLWSDNAAKSSHHAIVQFNLASAYADAGENQKAIRHFSNALLIRPDYVQALNDRGFVYQRIGEISSAQNDYLRAIKINPKFMMAYINFGIMNVQLKDFKKAKEYFDSAVSSNPEEELTFYNRAKLFQLMGLWNDALNDLNEAIRLNDKFTEAYVSRGQAYYQLMNMQKALSDFNRALLIDPDHAVAHVFKGNVYAYLKNFPLALKEYESALTFDPANKEAIHNKEWVLNQL